jgi:hypothetical protein
MRPLVILLSLAVAARGEEASKDLEQPPVSLKARDLRQKAQALWGQVSTVAELVKTKKPVPEADARAAMPVLEQLVEIFERSLREEWHGETNRTLAEAVRAWAKLRQELPPPTPPADDAQKKKAEKAAAARKQDVREFVMAYAAERRTTSLFRPCPKCEGRGESVSPFDGSRRECPACLKKGRLLDREGIVAARWLRFSPLYRATSRNEQEVNRLLGGSAPDADRDRFAPYLRGTTIKEVEDHDFWARVKAQDQVQATLQTNKTEKTDVTYVLLRIGKVWYLFDPNADRDLLSPKEYDEVVPPAEKKG